MIRHLGAIRGTELGLQARHLLTDRIENAVLDAKLLQLLRRWPAVPEQLFEDEAWTALCRQRRRRRRPRHSGPVGAAVARIAAAGDGVRQNRELERGERRLLTEVLRDHLIRR